MRRIVVFNSVSLDGVMQAPGRSDEDRRGGFERGGWAQPYSDPDMGRAAAESSATAGGLLFGRRTYEDFFSVWPSRTDNPFTDVLNKSPKFVVSTTLKDPLPWTNSTLLKGDASEAVSRLKSEAGKDLVILGSGELVRSLMRTNNLIDEYMLLIHPLVLGSGQRLFDDGSSATLKLVSSTTTTKGVIIARYQPEAARIKKK